VAVVGFVALVWANATAKLKTDATTKTVITFLVMAVLLADFHSDFDADRIPQPLDQREILFAALIPLRERTAVNNQNEA
jgi:hypothetical protein